MWQAKQENVGETMIKYMQNGPIMSSYDEFLCKLEQKLIHLSAKYGLVKLPRLAEAVDF